MAIAGLSTLGMVFCYGTGTTKPASAGLTELTRINSIGGISLSVESIDASAITDAITRRIAGRADTDETLNVTVNVTSATITEWTTLISAYAALTGESQMWFELYHPSLTQAWWFKATPPTKIPQPEVGQNELLTVEMQLIVNEYIGLDTKVELAA